MYTDIKKLRFAFSLQLGVITFFLGFITAVWNKPAGAILGICGFIILVVGALLVVWFPKDGDAIKPSIRILTTGFAIGALPVAFKILSLGEWDNNIFAIISALICFYGLFKSKGE